MNMKKVYIMLTQVGTLVSKSIKLYTKAKYNHASIGIDPNLQVFYSFARRLRFFPLVGGFVTELVNEGMFKYYPETECAMYGLKVSDAEYKKVCSILNLYLKNPQKYHYNLLALLGNFINKPISFNNRCTCSEFVAKILDEARIYRFSKPLPLVRPDDINNIARLELIYEGKMTALNTKKVG